MAVDVIMPQMGESIFEGTITKWLKKPGDKIERDEPLFEISTDKVDAEIPSPAPAYLKEIKVNEGQTVPIQTVVAVIDAAGRGAAAPAPAPAPAAPKQEAAKPAAAALRASGAETGRCRLHCQHIRLGACASSASDGFNGDKVRSSPLVRRSLAKIISTSRRFPAPAPAGASARRDILAAVEGGSPAPVAASQAAPAAASAAARLAHRLRLRTGGASRLGRARNRRAARKDVLRTLRSAADVRHAPAHRRAHGALEARFAARLFGG